MPGSGLAPVNNSNSVLLPLPENPTSPARIERPQEGVPRVGEPSIRRHPEAMDGFTDRPSLLPSAGRPCRPDRLGRPREPGCLQGIEPGLQAARASGGDSRVPEPDAVEGLDDLLGDLGQRSVGRAGPAQGPAARSRELARRLRRRGPGRCRPGPGAAAGRTPPPAASGRAVRTGPRGPTATRPPSQAGPAGATGQHEHAEERDHEALDAEERGDVGEVQQPAGQRPITPALPMTWNPLARRRRPSSPGSAGRAARSCRSALNPTT